MIVLDINPTILSIGKIDIKWYGLSYVLGFIICKFINQKIIINNFNQPEKDKLLSFFKDFDAILLFSILTGGRLGYFCFYLYGYPYTIFDILKIYEGGMSFYGASIAIILSTILYSVIRKVSFLSVLDLISIVSPIGIFLGRLANFINQELYGNVIISEKLPPWATIFCQVDNLPRHPAQLYEAALEGIILFVIMLVSCLYFKSLRKRGLNVGIFTIFYSIFRIVAEFFREDLYGVKVYLGVSLSTGQVLSIASIILCISFMLYKLFLAKYINFKFKESL